MNSHCTGTPMWTNAPGFDKNNWPAINNPSWGAEPFWQKTTEGTTERLTTPKTDTEREK